MRILEPASGGQDLALTGARRADEEPPHRIAIESVGSDDGEREVDRPCVGEEEPLAEDRPCVLEVLAERDLVRGQTHGAVARRISTSLSTLIGDGLGPCGKSSRKSSKSTGRQRLCSSGHLNQHDQHAATKRWLPIATSKRSSS